MKSIMQYIIEASPPPPPPGNISNTQNTGRSSKAKKALAALAIGIPTILGAKILQDKLITPFRTESEEEIERAKRELIDTRNRLKAEQIRRQIDALNKSNNPDDALKDPSEHDISGVSKLALAATGGVLGKHLYDKWKEKKEKEKSVVQKYGEKSEKENAQR